MDLHRLVYISRPAFAVRAGWLNGALAEIMSAGLRNNVAADITGLLGVEPDRFFQVLEGDRPVIEQTRERIFTNPHHFDVQVVAFDPISERDFNDWAVAFAMNDSLPPGAPRRPDFTTMTAAEIVERGLLLRRVGVVAEQAPNAPGAVA